MKPSLISVLILVVVLSSCSNKNNENSLAANEQEESGFLNSIFGDDNSSIEFVNITEPNEQAFSVNVPKGWKANIAMLRRGDGVQNVGSATSPDGNTHVFFGDPNIPSFAMPNPQLSMYEGMQTGNPLFQIRSFISADRFFNEYASKRFGNNQNFRILNTQPNQAVLQKFNSELSKQGAQANVTAADVTFEYQHQGKNTIGKITGVCMSIGEIWTAVVSGYTTVGGASEAALADKCLAELNSSFKANQQWQQRENQNVAMRSQQRHQQNMQMMQSSYNAHQNRMNNMQNNFNAHQNRMRDLSNTYDNANQSWMNNQQSNDRSHENFVDYIRDEQRVSNGDQYGKVESGYNNYYVNESTGEYFGTQSQMDVVPDNYEQWQPE